MMQTSKGRYWHFFDRVAAGGQAEIRLWVALPPDHRGQKTVIGDIHPEPTEMVKDPSTGTPIVFWRITDFSSPDRLRCYYDFQFTREPVLTDVDPERIGPYDCESEEYKRFTRSEPWIEITDEIRARAGMTVGDETNPYRRARKVFDWLIENMVYEYPDPEKRGAARSFGSMRGDCGEFSFVFCAMLRSLGIPSRTVTCMWFTEAGHNWAEFLLPGYGWIPADLSMAQALAGKSRAFPDEKSVRAFADSRKIPGNDPYWLFGNLYPERLIISVGNNLKVAHPGQGISRTFSFLQPGGMNAIPPAIEMTGFTGQPVEAGFFLFGDGCDSIQSAQEHALIRMVPGYLGAGDYEMAEKGLKKKLESSPNNSQALFDLAQCHLNREMYDEAIEALQGSLAGRGGSTKPVKDMWAHNLLGLCHKHKGAKEKARAEFQIVIDSGIDFQNCRQFARENLKEL